MARRALPYPFPGMDPWMQRRWGDTHLSLAVGAVAQLNTRLPDDLYANIEERMVVDGPPCAAGRSRRVGPDLTVMDHLVERPGGGGVAVAVPPPTVRPIRLARGEQRREVYLEVLDDADGGRLVASIEWVSPSNKSRAAERERCREKRERVLRAGAHAMEIDLCRGGDREAFFETRMPRETAYLASVIRADRPDVIELYPIGLRDPLPVLPVPLREGDPMVTLELRPLVERTWHDGQYWRTRYDAPPEPPLPADDAAWAAQVVDAWRAGLATG